MSVLRREPPPLGAVLILGLCLGGCRCAEESPLPPPVSSAVPVDRLAPGELAPGQERAFGLVLPRSMQVDSKHPKVVYAHGNVALLDVVEYVRRRVSRTDIRQEAGRFVFERVSLNEGDATQFFRLELFEREGMTHLTMRDLSQPPSTPGLSEQERRRRAGLLEDGRVDPELK